MSELPESLHKRNFFSFLWHAVFLSLAMNFMEINTVVPDMLMQSGGTLFHLGLLSAIMIGGTSLMQVVFAGFLSPVHNKKPFLLTGLYIRVLALAALGFMLILANRQTVSFNTWFILLLMAVFSFSGAFASVSYMDILGRSVNPMKRKRFFILRQTFSSIAVFISALIVRQLLKILEFPLSHGVLFLSAAALITLGSIGFWLIRQKPLSSEKAIKESAASGQDRNESSFSRLISIIKEDRNARLYLLLINTSGIGVAILPFLMGLAKNRLTIESSDIGNFVLIQILGMISANLFFSFFGKGRKYRNFLYAYIILGALIPIAALILSRFEDLYWILFLFSGAVWSLNQIVPPGILLEISTHDNRTLYTGLSGAGNILVVLFPVLGGRLIESVGFELIFVTAAALILLSFIPAKKIDCGISPSS